MKAKMERETRISIDPVTREVKVTPPKNPHLKTTKAASKINGFVKNHWRMEKGPVKKVIRIHIILAPKNANFFKKRLSKNLNFFKLIVLSARKIIFFKFEHKKVLFNKKVIDDFNFFRVRTQSSYMVDKKVIKDFKIFQANTLINTEFNFFQVKTNSKLLLFFLKCR